MAGVLKSFFVLSTLPLTLPLSALAHMEMVWPIPFNSKQDAAYYGGSVDYSMTSPLLADGSNYPCKHYQTQGHDKVQANYTPGQSYNITLAGSATHGGGSCQISVSYDNGQSFHVIKSIIGGCPLKPSYDFTIPASAPASDNALLAWTWFNLIGNREMYMNCARVSIQGGQSGQKKARGRSAMRKRQSALNSLPENFACNVGNGCQTLERHEVVFPNPGSVVEYGTDAVAAGAGPGYVLSGSTPTGNAFSGNGSAAPTSAPASNPSVSGGVFATVTTTTSTTSLAANATPSAVPTGTGSSASSISTLLTVTSSVTTTTTTTTTTTVIATSVPSPTIVSGSCTPGQFSCNSASTWSQCVPSTSQSGTYIYMGAVPAGTQCTNGSIVPNESGSGSQNSCTPVGTLLCEGSSAYQMCVYGGRVDMGPVAPGTKCMNGVIFPA